MPFARDLLEMERKKCCRKKACVPFLEQQESLCQTPCCCPDAGVIGVRNTFDMLLDPVGKENWHSCMTSIYGKHCPPCPILCPENPCRKRCPPPPPPPINCLPNLALGPPRTCGYIVTGDCCIPGVAGCDTTDCEDPEIRRRPAPIPVCRPCCRRNLCCRPPWLPGPARCGRCGPPRPMRFANVSCGYACWRSTLASAKVDTNLCASRKSRLFEKRGANMVFVKPPSNSCCCG